MATTISSHMGIQWFSNFSDEQMNFISSWTQAKIRKSCLPFFGFWEDFSKLSINTFTNNSTHYWCHTWVHPLRPLSSEVYTLAHSTFAGSNYFHDKLGQILYQNSFNASGTSLDIVNAGPITVSKFDFNQDDDEEWVWGSDSVGNCKFR